MMYKLKVQNPCSCFIKRALDDVQEFATKEEAQQEAKKMLSMMENEFCKKHQFLLTEQFGDFVITITPRR